MRRALFAQLGLAFVVASIGAVLTLLYAPELSVADLAIVLALSWLIYAADGALAIRPIRDGLVPLEEWSRRRDEPSARAAWRAAADLPFALLRRRASYVAVAVLIIVWDVVGVRRLGLSTASFLLFVPGSILVWLYWVALRFFVMEQILRPFWLTSAAHFRMAAECRTPGSRSRAGCSSLSQPSRSLPGPSWPGWWATTPSGPWRWA